MFFHKYSHPLDSSKGQVPVEGSLSRWHVLEPPQFSWRLLGSLYLVFSILKALAPALPGLPSSSSNYVRSPLLKMSTSNLWSPTVWAPLPWPWLIFIFCLTFACLINYCLENVGFYPSTFQNLTGLITCSVPLCSSSTAGCPITLE